MRRLLLGCWLILGVGISSAPARDVIEDSVVKIHTTQRLPNFAQPWTKSNPQQLSGSGVILEGHRILTNAHVVQYASRILVQGNQSTERIPAAVVAIAPGIDLALLKVDNDAFFDQRPPLPLGPAIPDVKASVNVYGYPIGGEQQSVTEGIVSRIEYAGFYYDVSGVRVQVDAALNPGNSGGPAVADGKVAGLVFSRISNADNIGYLIPVEEINLFLGDIADGTYAGKPRLLEQLQTVENEALRARLKLPGGTGGLMVSKRPEDLDSPLRPWDVITHIGTNALDNQGRIQVTEGLRLSFQYLIPQITSSQGTVPLTVLRDGQSIQLDVPVHRDSRLVVPYLQGEYPRHFVLGPMVFTTATQELVAGLVGPAQTILAARRNPLIERRFDRTHFDGEELVILGPRLFSHRLSEGYDSQVFGVVKKVNDVEIKNLVHLVETLRDAQGEFVTIELCGAYETLVFHRQELLDSTEEILNDEGVRNQYSDDLKAVWEKKR